LIWIQFFYHESVEARMRGAFTSELSFWRGFFSKLLGGFMYSNGALARRSLKTERRGLMEILWKVGAACSSRADHVTNLRAINVTPHVAQNDSITSTGKRRRSAMTDTPHGTKATASRNLAGR
jgi:hypothetical protein